MLDFMWRLMRDPDASSSVPAGIEDFFVEWREQMNAGSSEELESDDSAPNLWNVFCARAGAEHRRLAQAEPRRGLVKLYGGCANPTRTRSR